ncbi:hypothetical protein CLPU_1c02190 [Gottschalkia purinilytica]|uniref:YqbQ/XkdQ domain-containing protein n=1 Tax=Gottschalkia purinilytica TaxID=1503 RepID=A0A0L0WF04_GOTPU|nr:hypothetical protein [Gottschalkia purinilytica]KNF10054.1 hypothetical protein CLPU_1c02190 [Gottschalkia purinilytica]
MRIIYGNKNEQKDITEIVERITWSGDIGQVSRMLEITIPSSSDHFFPKINFGLGVIEVLQMLDDSGQEVFWGYIFNQSKDSQSKTLVAYDPLVYLTKSKLAKNYKNLTAEDITRSVCNHLGVIPGNIVPTRINQNLLALQQTGYETIMMAYTNASKQNGKKYMPRINKGKLDVIEKGTIVAKKELDSREDIMSSQYSESIENMINQIVITDDKGNVINYSSNTEWIKNYGLLQEIYQKEDEKDPNIVAKNMLNDIEREASVEVLGYMDCIAGNAVKIRDSSTGLVGLFYIDNDTHTFENGQHTMSLGLNFKNIMDEMEAQEEEKEETTEVDDEYEE